MLADQHALKQRWLDRAPRRMLFVFLELFLRQSEDIFADQRRNGNLNPILARTFMVGAVTA